MIVHIYECTPFEG